MNVSTIYNQVEQFMVDVSDLYIHSMKIYEYPSVMT